jgi:3-oxoacyl-[acyl-carrier protein] reductase
VGAPARALAGDARRQLDGHLLDGTGLPAPTRRRRRAHLVGSTAGLVGEAGHADYAAAKSAVLGGLLLSLKNEVVRRNSLARVNAVAPGWTESPMTRGHVSKEQVQRISRTMALRKVAQPEDVAAQVVALASPVISGHVTGQIVTVAGGMEGRVIHDG